MTEAVLDFRVPPQPHLSRVVRDSVADFALTHGVGSDDTAQFLTALGEVLANAIEHARAERPIEVEVRIGFDRIVATVQDSGVGLPSGFAVDGPLPQPQAERGRGLPLIRYCSDIFNVTSAPGAGTAVVLGRYLAARSSNVA